jgi:hypothetical protein
LHRSYIFSKPVLRSYFMLFPLLIKINFENVEGSSTVISKYFWIPWIRGTNTNVDCIYFHMFITWRLTTELLTTQSIKHIKACMHVWISTQEINSDISKWNLCEKVDTSRHLTTFTELSKYVLEPSTFSRGYGIKQRWLPQQYVTLELVVCIQTF